MPTSPRLLTSPEITVLTRQVLACGTRKQLDDLTRSIWRKFDCPENAEHLTRLKLVIQARRAAGGSDAEEMNYLSTERSAGDGCQYRPLVAHVRRL